MRRICLPLIASMVVLGCGGGETGGGEAAQAPSSADTVAAAQAGYNPAAFDSITWSSDSLALARGAEVFRVGCAECHGPKGLGDGGKVVDGDTLRPPSFVKPDWHLADDIDGIRRKVYSGNVAGMPHWGLRMMTARDIDAVAHYINDVLHKQGM